MGSIRLSKVLRCLARLCEFVARKGKKKKKEKGEGKEKKEKKEKKNKKEKKEKKEKGAKEKESKKSEPKELKEPGSRNWAYLCGLVCLKKRGRPQNKTPFCRAEASGAKGAEAEGEG